MSSQEQSFNDIALFLLETQGRPFSKSPHCQCPKITFNLYFS